MNRACYVPVEEQGLFSLFFSTVYEEGMSSRNILLEVDVI